MVYKYWRMELSTKFKPEPGNYVFAREGSPGWYDAIYVGQTGDLSTAFNSHPKMDCIRSRGATYIFVHSGTASEETRQAEADDIIQLQEPDCNSSSRRRIVTNS